MAASCREVVGAAGLPFSDATGQRREFCSFQARFPSTRDHDSSRVLRMSAVASTVNHHLDLREDLRTDFLTLILWGSSEGTSDERNSCTSDSLVENLVPQMILKLDEDGDKGRGLVWGLFRCVRLPLSEEWRTILDPTWGGLLPCEALL